MNSTTLDKDHMGICIVCKKKQKGSKMNQCSGCEKFACDTCGYYPNKNLAGWFCKNCKKK